MQMYRTGTQTGGGEGGNQEIRAEIHTLPPTKMQMYRTGTQTGGGEGGNQEMRAEIPYHV